MEDPQPSLRGLDEQEESVRIAVKALGDMRNSGSRSDINSRTMPAASSSSSSHSSNSAPQSPPQVSSSSSQTQSRFEPSDPPLAPSSSPAFVSRMSHFPLVGSALRVYEQGKASSRVVKYGAEMMESSVKSISRPVIERLPVNVNQLDEFACRQLDRLDRYRRPSASESPSSPTSSSRMAISLNPSSSTDRDQGRPRLKTKTLDGSAVADDEDDEDANMKPDEEFSSAAPGTSSPQASRRNWKGGGERGVPSWLEATSPFVAPPPPPPPPDSYSRSSTPTQSGDISVSERSQPRSISTNNTNVDTNGSGSGNERQVAQRSRWQAVLLEAGGLSAALSEESMRRLKYCLQWLQYATAHIDAQILILRDFAASLQPLPSSDPPQRRPPISEEHMRKLTDVRRDIVHTIRQVVDVVSKYAGGALPEPARGRVRGFILKLPQRWATSASSAIPSSSGTNVGVERERERETVAAAGSGTGALRRPGGQRRAAHRERGAGAEGLRSGQSSRATSPTSSPRFGRAAVARHGAAAGGPADAEAEASGSGTPSGGEPKSGQVSHSAALVASQRILVLATESLDMMRNVTGVVKDSLDRADAWVGRLRTVGIQRGAQEGEDTASNDDPNLNRDREFEFEFSDRLQHRHRRTDSAQSQTQSVLAYDDQDVSVSGMPSPFFSGSTASTAWGSSIPSTPGGTQSPGPAYSSPSNYPGGGGTGHAPNAPGQSPRISSIQIPIGAMSIASRYGTPRSGVVGLAEEDEEEEAVSVADNVREEEHLSAEVNRKVRERRAGEVKVVGVDRGVREEEEEEEVKKMDVDVNV